MPYDIASITRGLQDEFRLFQRDPTSQAENTATPERVGVLLGSLRRLTDQIQAQRDKFSSFVPDASISHWDIDMATWKGRLGAYQTAVTAAPRGDRGAILWNVTAPLLLGFYGGALSYDNQRPLDAVTPFMLANQIEVADAWRADRLRLFWVDLYTNLKALPGQILSGIWDAVPWWVWAGAGTAGALLIRSWFQNRSRESNVLPPPASF